MEIARARIVFLTVVAVALTLTAAASASDKQAILFSFSGKTAGNTPWAGWSPTLPEIFTARRRTAVPISRNARGAPKVAAPYSNCPL
jgi:hypothetical protein